MDNQTVQRETKMIAERLKAARITAEKTAARLEAHFTWDAVCQKLLALAQDAQN